MDANANVVNYIAIYHDLREIKEKEQQIAQSKLYDLITGYANKYLLVLRLNLLIEQKQKPHEHIIVMRILIKDNEIKKYDSITNDEMVIVKLLR